MLSLWIAVIGLTLLGALTLTVLLHRCRGANSKTKPARIPKQPVIHKICKNPPSEKGSLPLSKAIQKGISLREISRIG